jgi:hypothetical protein
VYPQAALWTGEMYGYLGAVGHPWNMRPDLALFQCRTLPQSNRSTAQSSGKFASRGSEAATVSSRGQVLVSELGTAVADDDIAIGSVADRCLFSEGKTDIPFQGRQDREYRIEKGSHFRDPLPVQIRTGMKSSPGNSQVSVFHRIEESGRIRCSATGTRLVLICRQHRQIRWRLQEKQLPLLCIAHAGPGLAKAVASISA